jgi:Flp pilus assembly protein TadB
MAEEIEHDPTLSPPVEAIHMPEPSYLPVVVAFGLMTALVGILLGIVIVILGLIIVIVALVRWIRSARAEMSELPLDHGH